MDLRNEIRNMLPFRETFVESLDKVLLVMPDFLETFGCIVCCVFTELEEDLETAEK